PPAAVAPGAAGPGPAEPTRGSGPAPAAGRGGRTASPVAGRPQPGLGTRGGRALGRRPDVAPGRRLAARLGSRAADGRACPGLRADRGHRAGSAPERTRAVREPGPARGLG